MELMNVQRKFKVLFDRFFNEKFELSDYYSKNLLDYFNNPPDNGVAKVFETPFFCDLLIYSLMNLGDASLSVRKFIIEILQIMFKNELQFSKFEERQGSKMLQFKFFRQETEGVIPLTLWLEALKLAKICLTHYTGLVSSVQIKVWEEIIKPDTHKQALKAAQANFDYISKLVWKLNEYNEESTLIAVLEHVIAPIRKIECDNVIVLDAEGEKARNELMLSSLKALLAIISEPEGITRDNKVSSLLHVHLRIEKYLIELLKSSRDPDFVFLLVQIAFRLYFGKVTVNCIRAEARADIPQLVIINFHNLMNNLIHRRLIDTAIRFSADCLMFWKKLEGNVTSTYIRHDRNIEVQNQFLSIILVPFITYSASILTSRNYHIDSLNVYFTKLSLLMSEHTIKVAYAIRSVAGEECIPQTRSSSITAVRQLFTLKNCLTEFQAGITYQALYYVLEMYVARTDNNGQLIVDDHPITSPEEVKLLSYVLAAVKMLLSDHKINWYESVEIISLQNCLMNLLKQNILPSKQLLQALDLIDLSIRKFLSPDLALLIESRRGSTLNEIVEVTRCLVEHSEWELRDSAFHLLLSCTELAFVQYIPLQKLILESNALAMAAFAAINDEEFYVQSTALRCLAAAAKMESIWRDIFNAHPNLYMQLISMLLHNPEGIVRKETARVLTEAHTHQKLQPDLIKMLYNVMTSAAIDDLHWEVQLAALQFWKVTIQYQKTDKGMIDGVFPSKMFCKARRKILTMNETIIHSQLINIMNDLAKSGCLTVLGKCLNEEFNIKVVEKAYDIAKDLVSILDLYKFDYIPQNLVVQSEEINMPLIQNVHSLNDSVDLTQESEQRRNGAIEYILSTTQASLIEDLYDNYAKFKLEMIDVDAQPDKFDSIRKWMNPNVFLSTFRKHDFPAMIKEKKNWHSAPRDLEVLIDEVLALGEVSKIITDECD